MNFITKCLILTPFLLLLLQVRTTNAFFGSFFDSYRPRVKTTTKTASSDTAQQPTANNTSYSYSTNISDSYNTNLTIQNSTNITAAVNTSSRSLLDFAEDENEEYYGDDEDLEEENERSRRDISNDAKENELTIAVNIFNSQMQSQSRSAANSIMSQSKSLNGLLKLFQLGNNNLATNGLNDLNSIATKLPISIQTCYNSYGFKFSDAMSTAKTKSDQCLSNKINEAKSIAQDFQNSISNAMTDFKDAFQLTAKCLALSDLYPTFAGLVAKSSCLIRAILAVRSETILFPLKMFTLSGQAGHSMTTIQSDMNKCGLEIVNAILDQSIASGKAINNCLDQQNGVTTSTSASDGSN